MNKRKKEKRSILPGVILVAFVAAMATFFLLLHMEKEALTDYEKIQVWCTNAELVEGLEITDVVLEEYIVQVEIDKTKIPGRLINEPGDLLGKRTKIAIPSGMMLTESMFIDDNAMLDNLYQPVVAGCKGDDLFQMVSGVLRKGDMVNIYTVNEELGETYLLWENIMVHQSFDSSGNIIASEDDSIPAARVNLLLEEGYVEQFYNELKAGSLRLVKLWK